MKYCFTFLFFVIFMLSLNLISSFSFSPTDLSFNLKPNEEECQKITIESESEIVALSDKWAESKDQSWSVGGFKTEASLYDIFIYYPLELSKTEREFEVCLSGETLGEYHGVLVLKEEQVGNSIIQMGVWLKVIISETGKIKVTPVSDTTSLEALKKNETQISLRVNEITDEANKSNNSGITGSVIGSDNSFTFNWGRILIGFIVAVVGMIAVVRFRKKYRRNY